LFMGLGISVRYAPKFCKQAQQNFCWFYSIVRYLYIVTYLPSARPAIVANFFRSAV
jgi:hypothetical protein